MVPIARISRAWAVDLYADNLRRRSVIIEVDEVEADEGPVAAALHSFSSKSVTAGHIGGLVAALDEEEAEGPFLEDDLKDN
jgi:hypothetical protein